MSKPEASETRAEKRAAETTVEASSKSDGNPNRPTPAPRITPAPWIGIGPIGVIIGVIVRIPVGIRALSRSRLLVGGSGSLRFGRPQPCPGNNAGCQDQHGRLHDRPLEDAVLCSSRHGYPRRQQSPSANHADANKLVPGGSGGSRRAGSTASLADLNTTTPRV